MDKEDLKTKFINLRLKSVKLSEIAKMLGISESTALRMNKKFSEIIRNSNSQKEFIASQELLAKIDEYLKLFEKHFKVTEKELDYYKDKPMTYEIALNSSSKLFKNILQLMSMKKTLSSFGQKDEVCNEFLSEKDFEENILIGDLTGNSHTQSLINQ